MLYDIYSIDSIVGYAQKLKGRSLREVCSNEVEKEGYKGKGKFGQTIEKFYFGYEPNSNPEPDFKEVGLELKCSPLKTLKNLEIRSKERLVLNIINYLEVHEETFDKSSFWKKNAHLLMVFYLHDKEKDLLDYTIKLVGTWKYPEGDLKIIKRDWHIINNKIKEGKAHELSEGDTFYLGACTKGSTAAKSLRAQPFSELKAKQRAYSLKQGYVNHIIAKISKNEKATYGKILPQPELLTKELSIEQIIISKFEPFYGKTPEEIEIAFNLKLNKKAKNYFANLTKAILGIGLDKKIEEFEKADIQAKTVRLKENYLPAEHISFPTFKYLEIVNTNWEDSALKNILEQRFFFVFYHLYKGSLTLKKVKFWNMPNLDILEAEKIWYKTVFNIRKGKIVKKVTPNDVRHTFFPKMTENKVCHVRPHAQDRNDTYPLPVRDQLTGFNAYTKHSFWLNRNYIREEIYLK